MSADLRAEQLATALSGHREGNRWMALCPAHDDREPSLSITVSDDHLLFHCHAGCSQEAVLAVLRAKGLWQEKQEAPTGLTMQEYAVAKGLDIDFLRAEGLSDRSYFDRPAVRIPYFSPDGQEVATRYRLALAKSDGTDNRFRWTKGSKVVPYGLNHLDMARAAGHVTLVEGESDAQTLWQAGQPALGLPGAATWKEQWAEYLDGIAVVHVVVEPDQGGDAVREWLATSAIRDRARLVRLGDYKDPSALYLSDPAGFQANWRAALDAATPWEELRSAERAEEGRAAYAVARDLLHDPRLMDRIATAIRSLGYVGDLRPALLVYLAMTSRLLERPQNLALIAQSSAGKSYTVDTVLKLMPPDALYLMRAGSSRALVYNEEEFRHRMVVVGKADSIPEDGPAASAIRSLAADNVMTYDVVERDELTGKFGTRHIEKEGPTGMITTGTRRLREQMATRMLEITVTDDPAHTRNILLAQARGLLSDDTPSADLEPFLALQRWLALTGRHSVAVPFAETLARLLPESAARAVRMRRDFRQLLTCVQAVAMLYQEQREKTPDGRVVATIDDYAVARKLLEAVFGSVATDGVTPAVREIVEAVKQGEQVSQATLAERLGLDKRAVSWRVGRALADGWLVNLEPQRGKPQRLVRGTPLPEDAPVLPRPEEVATYSTSVLSKCPTVDRHEKDRTFFSAVEDCPIPPSQEEKAPIFIPENGQDAGLPPEKNVVPFSSGNGIGQLDSDASGLFTPVDVALLSSAPDADGRRYVVDRADLWFDGACALWQGDAPATTAQEAHLLERLGELSEQTQAG